MQKTNAEQNEILISILAFSGAMVAVILCVAIIIFFRVYKKKEAQLSFEEERHQKEILQTRVEIQQQAYQNISQEIHDNIGQVLSLIKLNLGRMVEAPGDHPFKDKIITTNDLAGRVINDLRNLSKGLNPDFVQQFGLAGCISFELERLQNTGLYHTNMRIDGQVRTIALSKEFVVYRVVQECFNNTIKHAKANDVGVELLYTPENLTISISDNGRGFVVKAPNDLAPAKAGSGLNNMQKRIEMIGGNFSCRSEPGAGTNVHIVIPYSEE